MKTLTDKAFDVPWDPQDGSERYARVILDRSTPEQRGRAAQPLAIRLMIMSKALSDQNDGNAAVDRDYAGSIAARLIRRDPSIDDIWIAAELLREHERRTKKLLCDPTDR